ncbi:SpoIIIAH-like family protein [Halalkalibacterium halodurans]|uniref:SpoIIIAH-like family protein n=1 Tax=Halalkalibacterium halodurans TaxID=86665 RepID=UPI002AA97FB3|nr:SpoIIIAH-like family protein [Halalkalibacterium halodurans]MDY7223343.1 SpoIIIAH-like family protein [Halalkalibacterium halodurans]MDY7242564.1 SpoIIIAH-like family protein [Halalkalibacterium halodurans]
MVLKKQTVWLLTMLSLIVVLSAYYMMSPGGEDVAFVSDEELNDMQEEMERQLEEMDIDLGAEGEGEEVTVEEDEEMGAEAETDSDVGSISNVASNEVFATIRNQMIASREEMAENYTNIMGSPDATAEMKSEAFTKSQELQRLSQQEATLETLIKAQGYDDVLVLAEEEQVRIIVQAEELTAEQANEIMVMASKQLGSDRLVTVGHHNDSK